MAGTITRLVYQKRAADRVNIYLDGEFVLAVPELEAARLRVGQFLDDGAIERLHALDDVQKAYDRAVRYLSYRPRSRDEVRRHLGRAGIDPDVIEAALGRLAERGYLDDASFAQYWVQNRQQFRPKGAQGLRHELRQRGVDSAAIEGALTGLDAEADAYAAARPRALRLAELARTDPVAFRRRLADFLVRRGFAPEVAQEVTAQLARELRQGAPPEE